MAEFHYNVGELRRMIAESSQEFKPVIGPSVESNNKKNNDKSYKDAEKAAKDFDGGLKKQGKRTIEKTEDFNGSLLDYNLRTPASKEWKDKVEANLEGYCSTLEKDNGIEKANADFEGNKSIAKNMKKSAEDRNKERNMLAKSGLQSREMDLEEKTTMLENTIKPKRLTFKNTRFMNESQMLVRIPEEYKKDGQVIYMTDKVGNEYIVECQKSSTGYIETNVKGYNNKQIMNEQISRIEQLMNYTPGNNMANNTRNFRMNEDKNFSEMMELLRK